MHRPTRLKMTDLSSHLSCVLCDGYFVDATTIVECLHSFCRACIVKYLETNKFCPVCDVQLHKTKPLLSIRSDKTLQDVVYKLVPGLYQNEMKRRRDFYAEHPEEAARCTSEERGEGAEQRFIYTPDETISLSLEYGCGKNNNAINGVENYPNGEHEEEEPQKRYLQCPAAITIGHLKKFIIFKYSLPPSYSVDIRYSCEILNDDYTLMDIAYIYAWRRSGPMQFFYKVNTCPAKRRKINHPPPEINTETPVVVKEPETPKKSPPPPPEVPTLRLLPSPSAVANELKFVLKAVSPTKKEDKFTENAISEIQKAAAPQVASSPSVNAFLPQSSTSKPEVPPPKLTITLATSPLSQTCSTSKDSVAMSVANTPHAVAVTSSVNSTPSSMSLESRKSVSVAAAVTNHSMAQTVVCSSYCPPPPPPVVVGTKASGSKRATRSRVKNRAVQRPLLARLAPYPPPPRTTSPTANALVTQVNHFSSPAVTGYTAPPTTCLSTAPVSCLGTVSVSYLPSAPVTCFGASTVNCVSSLNANSLAPSAVNNVPVTTSASQVTAVSSSTQPQITELSTTSLVHTSCPQSTLNTLSAPVSTLANTLVTVAMPVVSSSCLPITTTTTCSAGTGHVSETGLNFATSTNEHLMPAKAPVVPKMTVSKSTRDTKSGKSAENKQLITVTASTCTTTNTVEGKLNSSTLVLEPVHNDSPVSSKSSVCNTIPVCSKSSVCNASPVYSKSPVCNTSPVCSKLPACNTSPVCNKLPVCNTSPVCNKSSVCNSLPLCSKSQVCNDNSTSSHLVPAPSMPVIPVDVASTPNPVSSTSLVTDSIASSKPPCSVSFSVNNLLPNMINSQKNSHQISVSSNGPTLTLPVSLKPSADFIPVSNSTSSPLKDSASKSINGSDQNSDKSRLQENRLESLSSSTVSTEKNSINVPFKEVKSSITAEFSDNDDLGCQPDLVVDEQKMDSSDNDDDETESALRRKINAIASKEDEVDVDIETDSGRASDISNQARSSGDDDIGSPVPVVRTSEPERTVAPSSTVSTLSSSFISKPPSTLSLSIPRKPEEPAAVSSKPSGIDDIISNLHRNHEKKDSFGALDLSTSCRKPGDDTAPRPRPRPVANPPVLDAKHRQPTCLPAPTKQHTACVPAPKHPTSSTFHIGALSASSRQSMMAAAVSSQNHLSKLPPVTIPHFSPTPVMNTLPLKTPQPGNASHYCRTPPMPVHTNMSHFQAKPATNYRHTKSNASHSRSNNNSCSSPSSNACFRKSPSASCTAVSPANGRHDAMSPRHSVPSPSTPTAVSPHQRLSPCVTPPKSVPSPTTSTPHFHLSPMPPLVPSTSTYKVTRPPIPIYKKSDSYKNSSHHNRFKGSNLTVINPDPNGYRQRIVIKNLDSRPNNHSNHHRL